MNEINWPEKYLPGTTDNYVSNEIIVANLSTAQVWPYLINTTLWPLYYNNISEISFEEGISSILTAGTRFRFTTFGLNVNAEVTEYSEPGNENIARLSFCAWLAGSTPKDGSALHAWLLEDLPGLRICIVTKESQIGEPAKQMAAIKPNPILNAHQDWLEGLAKIATERKTV
jgi:hypothetical protein